MSIYRTMAMAVVESFHYNCSLGLSVSQRYAFACRGSSALLYSTCYHSKYNTVSSDAIRCRSL